MALIKTEYDHLIQKAETCWLKKEYQKSINYYEQALLQNQNGTITKKGIRENIEELSEMVESQLLRNGR